LEIILSKVENLQSIAKSARHRWEAAVGTVRSLNLTAAQKRRAEAVSICVWHEGKKEEEEKEMMRKRKDCIVVGRT